MDSPPPDTDYDTEDMAYDGSVSESSEQMDDESGSNSANASDDSVSIESGQYINISLHFKSIF